MAENVPEDSPDEELRIETEPFGLAPEGMESLAREVAGHSAVLEYLSGTDHRLLAAELLPPAQKTDEPALPDRFRSTFYDYTNNRAILVTGPLDDPGRARVEESGQQPLPSPEEVAAAIEIVSGHPELGLPVREGLLTPYPAMPPVVESELPDGRVERTLAIGLLPAEDTRAVQHEIVGVNMIRNSVERYDDYAPPTSRAVRSTCGAPPSAGQATTGKGVAGQVWITVTRGGTELWRFLAVRPSASSGTWGSGIELRYVNYRRRRVLYQAHLPILNVQYDRDACGPYRDWQYEEGMLQASGANVAPGFVLSASPALTILDTGSDTGTFLGTGIYVLGQEVILVSEMQAGWYRYVSQWRLRADGVIRPRFGFDAVASSCVCNRHHHHAYWRLDFDIDDAPISGTEIQIDKYKNGESLVNQDSVVWYGAHFTHDVAGPPVDHVVGPDLIPQNW